MKNTRRIFIEYRQDKSKDHYKEIFKGDFKLNVISCVISALDDLYFFDNVEVYPMYDGTCGFLIRLKGSTKYNKTVEDLINHNVKCYES